MLLRSGDAADEVVRPDNGFVNGREDGEVVFLGDILFFPAISLFDVRRPWLALAVGKETFAHHVDLHKVN